MLVAVKYKDSQTLFQAPIGTMVNLSDVTPVPEGFMLCDGQSMWWLADECPQLAAVLLNVGFLRLPRRDSWGVDARPQYRQDLKEGIHEL